MCFLNIASSLDKIVQKAILVFLEPVFDKQFLDCSHGFRKNKNCHTCLRQIYYTWTGTRWFIEADFVNCFDRISYSILMSFINKQFYNYQVSQIIYSLLKVGYVNFGFSIVDSELKFSINKFHESLLSRFFCNIFLHELDLFAIFLSNKIFNSRRKVLLKKRKNKKCYLNSSWEYIKRLIKFKVNKRVFGAKINNVLQHICSQDAAFRKVKYFMEDNKWRRLTYGAIAVGWLAFKTAVP